MPTATLDRDDEGDGIATPVPLAATRPRSEQRFTVSGRAGVWRLVADLSCSATVLDITRPRGVDSILAALGERLVELERDEEPGSEF